MRTLEGGQAAGIVRWAWEDPAGRVQDAITRVRDMALLATGDALAELQDAGTMLSRLASSLGPAEIETGPVLVSIGSAETYAGTDGMAAQVLGLAGGYRNAWRHERRGPHGEWAGGGGVDATSRALAHRAAKNNQLAAERKARLDAARQARNEAAPASKTLTKGDVLTPDILSKLPLLPGETEQRHETPVAGETERENLIHEQMLHTEVEPVMAAHAARVLEQAKAHVEQRLAEVDKAANTHEGHQAALKAATEGSIAIAGGILAYIGVKLGVPDLAAIAGSSGLVLMQVIIEFFKRL